MHRPLARDLASRVRPSVLRRIFAIGALSALAACGGDHTATKIVVATSYSVSGTVNGLSAAGLVLQNKGGDALPLSADASAFEFPTRVAAGDGYAVTVATQPDGLSCSVAGGSGSNVQAPVTTVSVTCVPVTYAIAGTITGLTSGGLVLQNSGADPVTVAANAASFQFATQVVAGGNYDVTVAAQPDGLTCSVTHGSGSNVQASVTIISVACSPVTHTIAGTITGLTAGGLVLQNNGADNLALAANATVFQFATPVAVGGGYRVTVFAQPTGLTCSVSNATGSHVTADISGIAVTCSTRTLTIGGTISGLTGAGLVLQNNGADDLSIAPNSTTFHFATPVAYGGVYAATILTQPAGQSCSITQATAVATTDVTSVAVTCADIVTYTITAGSGANGSVSPSGAVVVSSGGGQGFVATPAAGYAIDQWSLDGTPVQSGGDVFTLANVTASHTLDVTFAQATLTLSVANLALAVNCLPSSGCTGMQDAALTGTPRQVIVSNTGTIAATDVSITFPTFPSGTTASTTCGSVLLPGSSCAVTITPGPEPSSSCNTGTAPTSGTLTVGASDANSSQAGVTVLGYGCLYQGGYVFAVDDTTPDTGSIGGKVLASVDQSGGVVWASDGSGGASQIAVLGIDELSTSSVPSPTSPPYPVGTPAYLACNGASDGACNTSGILSYYNFNRTAGGSAPTPLTDYAAGLCAATISGYSDWYLPAICELGYDNNSSGSGCGAAGASRLQNGQAHLVDTGIVGLGGNYWTSTEYSGIPDQAAWLQNFAAAGASSQFITGKPYAAAVRCARALTP
jgi:environmental stress-induced protein Ves